MNSKKYVLKHDFGYGENEEKEINKLILRNFKDIKVYVSDLTNLFLAKSYNNKIKFNNGEVIKINITKV